MTTDPSRPTSDSDLFARSASRLATLFYAGLDELGCFESVPTDRLPPNYRTLLAHHDHMTVALEAFHNSLMELRVVAEWHDGASYARSSLLCRQTDATPAQFGIMRIWLEDLPEAAQNEIVGKTYPLGRVLIRHNVLREVDLIALWQIQPTAELQKLLRLSDPITIFGRTAQILVDDRPTVQLLEIASLES